MTDLEFETEFDNSVKVTYTTFYMELIPCINCVSVGVVDSIGRSKSFRETFLKEIGAEGGQSDSLYKTCWSSWGVNFLDLGDDERHTGSIVDFDRVSGISIEVSTEF